MNKVFRSSLVALLLVTAPGAIAQEFKSEYLFDQPLRQGCFQTNPVSFLYGARFFESLLWPSEEIEDGIRHTSPEGSITIDSIEDGALSGRCVATLHKDAITPDFDVIATLRALVNEAAKTDVTEGRDGDALVWRWEGTGSFMMQSYEVRLTSGEETQIIWSTQ